MRPRRTPASVGWSVPQSCAACCCVRPRSSMASPILMISVLLTVSSLVAAGVKPRSAKTLPLPFRMECPSCQFSASRGFDRLRRRPMEWVAHTPVNRHGPSQPAQAAREPKFSACRPTRSTGLVKSLHADRLRRRAKPTAPAAPAHVQQGWLLPRRDSSKIEPARVTSRSGVWKRECFWGGPARTGPEHLEARGSWSRRPLPRQSGPLRAFVQRNRINPVRSFGRLAPGFDRRSGYAAGFDSWQRVRSHGQGRHSRNATRTFEDKPG